MLFRSSQTPDSWWGSVQMGNHSHKSHVDPFLAFLMLCASLALRLTLALPSFPSVSCSPCLRPLLLPLQIYKMTPYLSARNLPLPEVEQLLYPPPSPYASSCCLGESTPPSRLGLDSLPFLQVASTAFWAGLSVPRAHTVLKHHPVTTLTTFCL